MLCAKNNKILSEPSPALLVRGIVVLCQPRLLGSLPSKSARWPPFATLDDDS